MVINDVLMWLMSQCRQSSLHPQLPSTHHCRAGLGRLVEHQTLYLAHGYHAVRPASPQEGVWKLLCCMQIPRFAFEKFPGAKPELTTQMKSVGEAMAIGRTFQESFQKASCHPSLPSGFLSSPLDAPTPPLCGAATPVRHCMSPDTLIQLQRWLQFKALQEWHQ